MTRRVLVVEDEPKLAALLVDYLQQAGFDTFGLDRGDTVEPWLQAHRCDLVLLDLMLPGKDGLEVFKGLRRFSQVPVLMVTAKVDEIDRLVGLELGADDYICKPFSPKEVIARVRAVLRRSSGEGAPTPLALDAANQRAEVAGKDVGLTAAEFHLLRILSACPGRVLSRKQLIEAMYLDGRTVTERTVDSHILKLRRKLAACLPEQELVRSVYGAGYRYDG